MSFTYTGRNKNQTSLSIWEPVAVLLAGTAGFIAWALYAGRDLSWDFLNYHLYLGMHANGDSLAQNFFPASSSSYLNPYAYWPLGAMIAAKWPAVAVGAMLASIQSLAVLVTWYLAKQLFPDDTRKAITLRAVATVVGVVCPLVLTEVGTSFIDLNTAIPVVLGVALLLKALDGCDHRIGILVISGACFGLATALKLTNAPFSLAVFASLIAMCLYRPDVNWKLLALFGISEVAGFVIGHGVWGYQLWREFGNPFFPFLNSLFQPAVPAIGGAAMQQQSQVGGLWHSLTSWRSGLQQRFLPISLWDWLLRPLYMVDPVAGVYTEVRAPDARFLALLCLAPLALWKLREKLKSNRLVPVLLFFLFAWILWLAVFGNGRYLIPLMLVVGPALVSCANVYWPQCTRAALAGITIFVCVQVALMSEAKYRWEGVPWQGTWISAELPDNITDRPVTFATFDLQSVSWLTAFVHPESRILYPDAQGAIPAAGPGSDRFTKLLASGQDIVAVFSFSFLDAKTLKPFPSSPAQKVSAAERIGLQIDLDSCVTGTLAEQAGTGYGEHVARDGNRVSRMGVRGFFFCRAAYAPQFKKVVPSEPAFEAVFDKIEDTCPPVFPPRATTTCEVGFCWRKYGSTENRLTINELREVNADHYNAFDNPFLGTVEDLLRDPSKIDCHRDLGHYVPWSPGAKMLSRPTPPRD